MDNIKCLVPMCTANSQVRGLCFKHYNTARRLVNMERTTWDDLERAGKSAPQKVNTRGVGEAGRWFLEAEQAGG